jgi:catechol 2,3-dioxygenase-like lactoylglutathione lyase family enzyme
MDFDAIVIGSGQAGVPLATRLARSGKRVLLAERRRSRAIRPVLTRPDVARRVMSPSSGDTRPNDLLRTPWSIALALLLAAAAALPAGAAAEDARVHEVGCVGMTVADLERSVAFYEKVLDFKKVLEQEAAGAPYEALTGVFALRTRTARVRLGSECLELTEYLGPKGRPVAVGIAHEQRPREAEARPESSAAARETAALLLAEPRPALARPGSQ